MKSKRPALYGLIGFSVCALLIAFVWGSVWLLQTTDEIQTTQLEGTPTGKTILRTADRIEDCTTPGGECYERGQSQTTQAVGDIGKLSVYASACAADIVNKNFSVEAR